MNRNSETERKRIQKIRKNANQSFLDFHNIDRNDPLFMEKYSLARAKRDEQRNFQNSKNENGKK